MFSYGDVQLRYTSQHHHCQYEQDKVTKWW